VSANAIGGKLVKMRCLFLCAFGIHTGGGLVLLKSLLNSLKQKNCEYILDWRLESSNMLPESARVRYIAQNIFSRIGHSVLLVARAQLGDIVICFNSLPPLIKSKAYVITFVQAPHFVDRHKQSEYRFLVAIRIQLERLWFKLGIRNSDEIWVQTYSMACDLKIRYPNSNVRVMSLVDDELMSKSIINFTSCKKEDLSSLILFYPADGVGHKNHLRVLKAWSVLRSQGYYPNLLITLTENEMAYCERKLGWKITQFENIKNLGRLTRHEVLIKMETCSALIFPSLAETFGLPLLEASFLKTPIIAGEKDFVRDVCSPDQTFDPESENSIANAILRFAGQTVDGKMNLCTARTFVDKILQLAS
jgi:glycosyltransferase involved in cell wall biosynthesis